MSTGMGVMSVVFALLFMLFGLLAINSILLALHHDLKAISCVLEQGVLRLDRMIPLLEGGSKEKT